MHVIATPMHVTLAMWIGMHGHACHTMAHACIHGSYIAIYERHYGMHGITICSYRVATYLSMSQYGMVPMHVTL